MPFWEAPDRFARELADLALGLTTTRTRPSSAIAYARQSAASAI